MRLVVPEREKNNRKLLVYRVVTLPQSKSHTLEEIANGRLIVRLRLL